MKLEIFGHPGCTTVKKARQWAEDHNLEMNYQNFSATKDLPAQIRQWVDACGIDAVFNRSARTLKTMSQADQDAILASKEAMISAMANDPRLIKRPVGTNGNKTITGFKPDQWSQLFLSAEGLN